MNLKEDPSVGYDIGEDEGGGNPLGFFTILRRRWLSLLVTLVVITFAGTLFTKTRPKVYTSSSAVVVSTQDSGAGGAGELMSTLLELTSKSTAATQAAIISSADLINEALGHMTHAERMRAFGGDGLPIWAFDLDQKKDTDAITVTIHAYSPKLAATFANLVVEQYLTDDLSRTNAAARNARIYVEKELVTIKGQLYDAAKQLADFQKKSGLVSPLTQMPEAARAVMEARALADKARVAAIADMDRVANIERQIHKENPEIQMGRLVAENPEFAQTRLNISSINSRLADARSKFQPDSPEVSALESELKAEQDRLKTITHTIVSSVTEVRNPILTDLLQAYAVAVATQAGDDSSLKTLTQQVDARQADFTKVPAKALKFAEMQETVLNLGKTYDLLTSKYYELYIQEKSNLAHGFQIQTASPSSEPSSLSVFKGFLISLFVGLIFGGFAASLSERMDTRIHDPGMAEKLAGLTMLTAVPETKSPSGSKAVIIGTVTEGASGFIESYRLLRNNITFAAADKDIRIIAITSAGKAEGKSTTVLNLAIAMGMDGKRVLLIDADLRRPALHNYVGATREVGLTNVAKGMVTLEQAVVSTPYEGVSCLVSGPLPPNPTEFLNSSHVRQLIEDAATKYDIVLIDSPPCTGLSDVQVVSTFVDGILLVVALDITQKHYLGAAVRLLRLANAPTIGMVLNRVRYNRTSYYYSYYYYYGYYGEDDEKDGKRKPRRPKN